MFNTVLMYANENNSIKFIIMMIIRLIFICLIIILRIVIFMINEIDGGIPDSENIFIIFSSTKFFVFWF